MPSGSCLPGHPRRHDPKLLLPSEYDRIINTYLYEQDEGVHSWMRHLERLLVSGGGQYFTSRMSFAGSYAPLSRPHEPPRRGATAPRPRARPPAASPRWSPTTLPPSLCAAFHSAQPCTHASTHGPCLPAPPALQHPRTHAWGGTAPRHTRPPTRTPPHPPPPPSADLMVWDILDLNLRIDEACLDTTPHLQVPPPLLRLLRSGREPSAPSMPARAERCAVARPSNRPQSAHHTRLHRCPVRRR